MQRCGAAASQRRWPGSIEPIHGFQSSEGRGHGSASSADGPGEASFGGDGAPTRPGSGTPRPAALGSRRDPGADRGGHGCGEQRIILRRTGEYEPGVRMPLAIGSSDDVRMALTPRSAESPPPDPRKVTRTQAPARPCCLDQADDRQRMRSDRVGGGSSWAKDPSHEEPRSIPRFQSHWILSSTLHRSSDSR